jgi:hypothetical protein
MTFFNKKEDVIKIELTPHGRKLLSQGKLKPEFYAFFDDDVIYDSERGGFTETNLQSKTRILSETPSLRPQTTHRGVDTGLKSSLSIDKNDSMTYAIGTNNFSDQDAVGWEAYILQGEADTFSYNYTTNTNENIKIPQVNSLLNFTMSIGDVRQGGMPTSNYIDYSPDMGADDASFIRVKEQEMLIYLSEKNGFNTSDNYTMDVFLYEEDKAEYKKLKFLSRDIDENEIKNDILRLRTPGSEDGIFEQPEESVDADTVEQYFDLMIDSEVSRIKICEGIRSLSAKDIFVDLQDYDCDDLLDKEEALDVNIYSTGNNDIEVCEDE